MRIARTINDKMFVIVTALMASVLFFALAATNVSAISGSISGHAYCFYGNNHMVGAWVDASTGTDGWATLTGTSNNTDREYSYNLSQSTSSYTVTVGCSGTPASWGGSFKSPILTSSYYDLACTYQTGYPNGGFFCATI